MEQSEKPPIEAITTLIDRATKCGMPWKVVQKADKFGPH